MPLPAVSPMIMNPLLKHEGGSRAGASCSSRLCPPDVPHPCGRTHAAASEVMIER